MKKFIAMLIMFILSFGFTYGKPDTTYIDIGEITLIPIDSVVPVINTPDSVLVSSIDGTIHYMDTYKDMEQIYTLNGNLVSTDTYISKLGKEVYVTQIEFGYGRALIKSAS